jgi:hypothetical protein
VWARRAAGTVLLLTAVAYAARLFWIVDRYSVNIMFNDAWSFYPPVWMFDGLWQAFSYQHAAHRQGLGNLMSKLLLPLTKADVQREAMVIAVLMVLATGLFLFIRRKVTGQSRWYDGFVVLMMLSPAQYAVLMRVPNPAHGILPLILVMLCSLAVTMKRSLLRDAVLPVLVFVSVYTGFGLFLGVAVPSVFVALAIREALKGDRKASLRELVTAGLCVAAAGTFFIDYRFGDESSNIQHGSGVIASLNMMAYQFSRLAGFATPTAAALVAGARAGDGS